MDMVEKTEKMIKEHNLLHRGQLCIVGVSGGADSMALLHILCNLRQGMGFEILAVHVHHGLRKNEADRDAVFVENICKEKDIPFVLCHVDVQSYVLEHKVSTEEGARILRYRAFAEVAGQYAAEKKVCIAVAHHCNDQAETLLMNLCRGSGLRGLTGMHLQRGNIIRPLLFFCRREIEEYLKAHQISYITDSTNASLDYTRNRVRRSILPMLEAEVNIASIKHISAAAGQLGEVFDYIQVQARKHYEQVVVREDKKVGLSCEKVKELPLFLQGEVIRFLLEEAMDGLRDISSIHIEGLKEMFSKETGSHMDLPQGYFAHRDYCKLWIIHKSQKISKEKENGRFECRRFLYTQNMEIPTQEDVKWFDEEAFEGEVCFRTRKTGDYIEIAGGKHKSIKALMIDEKIPALIRDKILLVADGSHIVWVVGYRISQAYKIKSSTTYVREIKYIKGDTKDVVYH